MSDFWDCFGDQNSTFLDRDAFACSRLGQDLLFALVLNLILSTRRYFAGYVSDWCMRQTSDAVVLRLSVSAPLLIMPKLIASGLTYDEFDSHMRVSPKQESELKGLDKAVSFETATSSSTFPLKLQALRAPSRASLTTTPLFRQHQSSLSLEPPQPPALVLDQRSRRGGQQNASDGRASGRASAGQQV